MTNKHRTQDNIVQTQCPARKATQINATPFCAHAAFSSGCLLLSPEPMYKFFNFSVPLNFRALAIAQAPWSPINLVAGDPEVGQRAIDLEGLADRRRTL
eukprot:4179144-Prymnesium_polylepis.1